MPKHRIIVEEGVGEKDFVSREPANDAALEAWRGCGAERGAYEASRGTALVAFGEYVPSGRDA